MSEPPHQEPTDKDFMEAHIAALEAKLSKMEEKYFNAVKDNAEVAKINADYLVELVDLRKRVEGLDTTLSMFQGFSVSELLRVIAKDYDRSDVGNSIKMRRAMWLKDLADKLETFAAEEETV